MRHCAPAPAMSIPLNVVESHFTRPRPNYKATNYWVIGLALHGRVVTAKRRSRASTHWTTISLANNRPPSHFPHFKFQITLLCYRRRDGVLKASQSPREALHLPSTASLFSLDEMDHAEESGGDQPIKQRPSKARGKKRRLSSPAAQESGEYVCGSS